MKPFRSTAAAACFVLISACQTTTGPSGPAGVKNTNPDQPAPAAVSEAEMAQLLATATCKDPLDRRDQWMAGSKPGWPDYVAGHKKQTGKEPGNDSRVAQAYRAYLDSGQSHTKAQMLLWERQPRYGASYPSYAKCWVRFEG